VDTYAAVRALQAHGFSLEQAESLTAVIQEATSGTPTVPELRTFVLEQDVKLERLRTEMHQEFGTVRSDLAALREEMRGGFALSAQRLETLERGVRRLAWLPWGILALSLGILTLLVQAFAVH
jgi:hypothetical protein